MESKTLNLPRRGIHRVLNVRKYLFKVVRVKQSTVESNARGEAVTFSISLL
jgi:hypothetical protein